MNKLKAMIAVVLILPLAGWASSLTVEAGSNAGMTAPGAMTCKSAALSGPQAQYDCCWIFMGGSWRCVPCD